MPPLRPDCFSAWPPFTSRLALLQYGRAIRLDPQNTIPEITEANNALNLRN